MSKQNKESKKIAFIVSSLTTGGAERNALNLSLSLPQNYYKAEIITLFSAQVELKNEYKNLLNKLRIHKLSKFSVSTSFFFKVFLSPYIIIKLLLIVYSGKYNLLLASHEYNTFYLVKICSAAFKIPTIFIVGNNVIEDIEQKPFIQRAFQRFFFPRLLKSADCIVAVSEGIKKQLNSYYKIPLRNVVRIYNGVDRKKIISLTKQIYRQKNKPRIIVTGRLIARKGHIHLINAVKLLQQEYNYKVDLWIIGNGILFKKLNSIISNLRLKSQVTIVENPGAKIYEYLKASDIFVFTSDYEGFGNSIIEAMCCKLPIISFDCKFGPREILKKSYSYNLPLSNITNSNFGILIPQTDDKILNERRLAKTIKQVLEKKKLKSKYSRMSFIRSQEFTIEKMTTQYDTLIRKKMN